jgi:hypothetical protein
MLIGGGARKLTGWRKKTGVAAKTKKTLDKDKDGLTAKPQRAQRKIKPLLPAASRVSDHASSPCCRFAEIFF